jgi:hypothetical protein
MPEKSNAFDSNQRLLISSAPSVPLCASVVMLFMWASVTIPAWTPK